MLVRFVPFSDGLGKRHGSGGFFRDAYVIKVDGMIAFVLLRDNNNGISRDFFLNRNVNTQEKANDKKAKQDHSECLVSLSHSL
jgi:hypothetical protein